MEYSADLSKIRFSEDRAKHSLGVAKLMYDKVLASTSDVEYAHKMFQLGWLHDIGYQFTDEPSEHAHVGGSFLKEQNYEFWQEVYYHGVPSIINATFELNLLNYADMHTDSKGNYVSFKGRLRDIEERHGKESVEYVNAEKVINKLVENKFTY